MNFPWSGNTQLRCGTHEIVLKVTSSQILG